MKDYYKQRLSAALEEAKASQWCKLRDLLGDLPPEAMEIARKATAGSRHMLRVAAVEAAATVWLAEHGLPTTPTEIRALAELEENGTGGRAGCGIASGGFRGTQRMSWAKQLGSGRAHANDGGAWDRAIEVVVQSATHDVDVIASIMRATRHPHDREAALAYARGRIWLIMENRSHKTFAVGTDDMERRPWALGPNSMTELQRWASLSNELAFETISLPTSMESGLYTRSLVVWKDGVADKVCSYDYDERIVGIATEPPIPHRDRETDTITGVNIPVSVTAEVKSELLEEMENKGEEQEEDEEREEDPRGWRY